MAKGYNQHQQRHQGLNAFGKDLTRRSGSCCELCEASGVKLSIYEVPPIPVEPELEHCVFVCETCLQQLEQPKQRNPDHWRCLTKAVWSQVPAVQVVAVTMAKALADQAWAAELLEQLYLDPEVEAWVEKSSL
ncbi:MAG: phnA protein [Motiliproteus sp.]|nr:phnA protein [Motiliproteus sp.]MCW9051171.1 phnA protein [Motiliproteus sp.]